LRDIWADESANQGGTGRVDVLPWLSKMTLDVIGLAGAFVESHVSAHLDVYLDIAGFHYKFDALTNQQSELNNTFDALFKNDSKLPVIPLLKAQFPILRFIVSSILVAISSTIYRQDTIQGWHDTDEFLRSRIHIHAACAKVAHLSGGPQTG
jgi:hypothetical protein